MRPQILIVVEGGVVRDVMANRKGLSYLLVDLDDLAAGETQPIKVGDIVHVQDNLKTKARQIVNG